MYPRKVVRQSFFLGDQFSHRALMQPSDQRLFFLGSSLVRIQPYAVLRKMQNAEFERDLISERNRAGLIAARARGRRGGRRHTMTPGKVTNRHGCDAQ